MGENRRTGRCRSGLEQCAVRRRSRRSRAAAAVRPPRRTARQPSHRRGPRRAVRAHRARAGAAGAQDAGRLRGRPRVFLLELGELTARRVYTGDARDAGRFLHLSAAAVALSAGDWRPDVIHCHDWHTALTPVLQRLEPRSTAPNVLTLHNVGYQGVFADTALREQGFACGRAGAAAPMRAAAATRTSCARAFARPIASRPSARPTPRKSAGLRSAWASRTCSPRAAPTSIGILNGVDYSVWSPDQRSVPAAALRRDRPDAETPH